MREKQAAIIPQGPATPPIHLHPGSLVMPPTTQAPPLGQPWMQMTTPVVPPPATPTSVPNVPPPLPTITVEALAIQQQRLQEQIHQSEQNLAAQQQVNCNIYCPVWIIFSFIKLLLFL
jgi:hypothetical protein